MTLWIVSFPRAAPRVRVLDRLTIMLYKNNFPNMNDWHLLPVWSFDYLGTSVLYLDREVCKSTETLHSFAQDKRRTTSMKVQSSVA